MRYSCAASVIVRNSDGGWLLLRNRGARRRGEALLTPVGGKAYVSREQMVPYLRLGASFTLAPSDPGGDLVFRVGGAISERFVRLFADSRELGRATAQREMREELCEEECILRHKDLAGVNLRYSHFGTEIARSDAAGGEESVRVMQFFTLEGLSKAALAKLEDSPKTYFALPDEINQGVTNEGRVKIASIAQLMLPR